MFILFFRFEYLQIQLVIDQFLGYTNRVFGLMYFQFILRALQKLDFIATLMYLSISKNNQLETIIFDGINEKNSGSKKAGNILK